jgi:hypothetical protein
MTNDEKMPLTQSIHPSDLAHDESRPYLWTMNFGPQHPATHTTLRLVVRKIARECQRRKGHRRRQRSEVRGQGSGVRD